MELITEAEKIAIKCLRGCYTEDAIMAGKSLWFDYWARDAFFSSWGALELKDYAIVKKTLLFFIKYQKKNGMLPLRVDKYPLLLKLIGIKINRGLKPRYLEDKMRSYPRDQNSLFVITAFEYIRKTKDKEFAEKYLKNFEKAVGWNFSKDNDDDYLIEENYYATWADSLRKKGKVLYTNVLHFRAVQSMGEIYKILGDTKKQKQYLKQAELIKNEINRTFWNGEHYADWYDWKRHNFFSSDGNILAILFDVADKEKAESILDFIDRFKLEDFSLATNYPNYAFWNISFSIRLCGLSDYHNGMVWLWPGCLDVIVRSKLNQKDKAKNLLKKLSKKIVEYGSVYEVYEKNGKPVHRALFRSESSFAWSAGLFIWALHEFDKKYKLNKK